MRRLRTGLRAIACVVLAGCSSAAGSPEELARAIVADLADGDVDAFLGRCASLEDAEAIGIPIGKDERARFEDGRVESERRRNFADVAGRIDWAAVEVVRVETGAKETRGGVDVYRRVEVRFERPVAGTLRVALVVESGRGWISSDDDPLELVLR